MRALASEARADGLRGFCAARIKAWDLRWGFAAVTVGRRPCFALVALDARVGKVSRSDGGELPGAFIHCRAGAGYWRFLPAGWNIRECCQTRAATKNAAG